MFFNYIANQGISINTYRKPECTFGGEDDLVVAMENEESISVCLDAAESASFGSSVAEQQIRHAIEQYYAEWD